MFRLRLKYRIAVTIFVLELLMIIGLLWVTLSYSFRTSHDHLKEMDHLILSMTRAMSRTALLTDEFFELHQQFKEIISLSNATHVVLANEMGEVVSSSHFSEIGEEAFSMEERSGYFWLREDVTSLSGELGTLSVEFSSLARDSAYMDVRNLAVGVAAAGMSIIAVVGFVMGTVLTRRLERLRRTAQKISSGDFNARTALSGKDEIALLGQAFDRMANEMTQSVETFKESEARFRSLVGNLPAVVYRLFFSGNEWKVLFVSKNSYVLSGYPAEDFMNENLCYPDLIYSEDRESVRKAILDGISKKEPYSVEYRFHHKNGRLMWVLDQGQCLFNDEGDPLYIDGAVFDMTERKQYEDQTRKLSSAIEQAGDAIMITDPEGRIEYVNPAFEKLTGFSDEEVLGENANVVKSQKHDTAFFKNLWQTLQEGKSFQDVIINRKKDGSLFYEDMCITPLEDSEGNITHYISTGRDISERMRTQKKLYQLAYHDLLTQLPNRALFLERLSHAIKGMHGRDKMLGVLFMDLDRFKTINDTLGHDVGDKLLQAFSVRVRGCLREVDTVARLSGDEFIVLLEGMTSSEDADRICLKILKALSKPFYIESRELFITTSIGISLFPKDARDAFSLMKYADVAMYRAKELGRNNYQFYDTEMSVIATSRFDMETKLRRALERSEFELYYQPQISVSDLKIMGVEVLVRWRHPEKGILLPAEFVPILEDTGLIVPVGAWVLKTALVQAKTWTSSGISPNRLAINLSSRQFNSEILVDEVFNNLRGADLDPTVLELEITESFLMENKPMTLGMLKKFSNAGIRLSVDDFGTGYSSLAYLKRFPIDTLKIDGSFIRDLTSSPDDAAIVRAIIAMAVSLKMETVAEGVETEAQFDFLKKVKCDSIQGFFFNPPLSAQEMTSHLEGNDLI